MNINKNILLDIVLVETLTFRFHLATIDRHLTMSIFGLKKKNLPTKIFLMHEIIKTITLGSGIYIPLL